MKLCEKILGKPKVLPMRTLVALVLSGCASGELVYEKNTGDYLQQLHVYGAKTEVVKKGDTIERKFDLDHDGKVDWIVTVDRDNRKLEERHYVDGKLTFQKKYGAKNGI